MENISLKVLEHRAEKDGLFIEYTPVAAMPGYGAVMTIVSDKNGKRVVRTGESTNKERPLTAAFKNAGIYALCAYYGIDIPENPAAAANQQGGRNNSAAPASDRTAETRGNNTKAGQQQNMAGQSGNQNRTDARAAAKSTSTPQNGVNTTGQNLRQNNDTSRTAAQAANQYVGTQQNRADAQYGSTANAGGTHTQARRNGTGSANAQPSGAAQAAASARPDRNTVNTGKAEQADAAAKTAASSGNLEQTADNIQTDMPASQESDSGDKTPADAAASGAQETPAEVKVDFIFENILAVKGKRCSEIVLSENCRKILRGVAGLAPKGNTENVSSSYREDVVKLLHFLKFHEEDKYGSWYYQSQTPEKTPGQDAQ